MNDKAKSFFIHLGSAAIGFALLFICNLAIVCSNRKPIQQNPDVSKTTAATTDSLIAALQQANDFLCEIGQTISDIATTNSAAKDKLVEATNKLGEIANLYKSIEAENTKLVENNKAAEKLLVETRSTIREANIYNQTVNALIQEAIKRNERIIQEAQSGTAE